MRRETECAFTVTVTAENVETGKAKTTRFFSGPDGRIVEVGNKDVDGETEEWLRALVGLHPKEERVKAKVVEGSGKNEVLYEVAKKIAEETMCRDGDGNYHLIKSERAGADVIGRAIEQKRSRELMSEDDARYWALENLRMEEYEKAFQNE